MKASEDVRSRRNREVLSEAVQAQLGRVLASECFKGSLQHKLLLKTIVDESLAERFDLLKEVVLANTVFGRAEYDPSKNTQVRVAVNAVRRKLAKYYEAPGADDNVVIDIPLGHYVAVFSPLINEPATLAPPRQRKVLWVGAAAGLVVALALWAVRRVPIPQTGVPTQVTFDTGWTSLPALSRDGSILVYSSDRGPRGDANIWIQKAGSPARQLTNNPALDTTPDISPDGSEVAFRSTRNGDGLWLMPTNGEVDQVKLLTRGGYSPRFSPDGLWIAYSSPGKDGKGHVFVVPATGGSARQIDFGTADAATPIWSPDGNEIVFVAHSANGGEYDLWRVATHGREDQLAQGLGIQAKLKAQHLPVMSGVGDCPQDWIDERLLFLTHQHDVSFLFEVPLRPGGAAGAIRAVPSAVGAEGVRAVHGRKGEITLWFAIERRQGNVWTTDSAGATPLQQATRDGSVKTGFHGTWPALSGDGNVLAYVSERGGSADICLRDLRTGSEQTLNAQPWVQSPLFLDATGKRVVFVRREGGGSQVFLRGVGDKTERLLTGECPILHDWSKDGQFLLCSSGTNLFSVLLSDGGRVPALSLAATPMLARFSPDHRWISFVTFTGQGDTVAGFVAPTDGSDTRIPVCTEKYGLSLHWAPDGRGIYYWSTRDNFRCLYKQLVDERTKIPQGEAVAVLHRHALQHYPMAGGTLAISSSRMAMTLKDQLANIWMNDLRR